jgi:hypothetical protein
LVSEKKLGWFEYFFGTCMPVSFGSGTLQREVCMGLVYPCGDTGYCYKPEGFYQEICFKPEGIPAEIRACDITF